MSASAATVCPVKARSALPDRYHRVMKIPVRPAWLARAVVVAAVAAGVAAPVAAQVYKCVDRAGRITYQQKPCPDAQTGGPMSSVIVDNGRTQAGEDANVDWTDHIRRKEVVPGMPRAVVIQAYGSPQEMRPGRARENATEVWSYRRPDLASTIGFSKGTVAWLNDNPADKPAPDTPRQTVHHGMPCGSLAGAIGAPTNVAEVFDETLLRKVMRHQWDPTPEQRETLVVTCADDKIERIERNPA